MTDDILKLDFKNEEIEGKIIFTKKQKQKNLKTN